MAQITTKELGSIQDCLKREQVLISKYRSYADTTSDSVLKEKYRCAADKHQEHFNTLYALLK